MDVIAEAESAPVRKYKSLNKAKALEQAKRGLNNSEIARLQGVDQSTVWQFLNRTKPERQALQDFKTGRADAFAMFQGKCLNLQQKILDSLLVDGVLAPLKPSEKTGLLMALNASAGTSFDKERLERGQSTSNHSVMSTMLGEVVKGMYVGGKPASGSPLPSNSRKQARKQQPEP